MSTNGQVNYVGVNRAAELLHVSPKTIGRWAREGKLPFLRTLGGHRRFDEARIRELAASLVHQVEAGQ
jgi:excisionase family DNA binding protein